MTQPYYLNDGTRVPSVTTILATLNQPFLLAWYLKLGKEEADRQRDAAADLGTRTHSVCEAIVRGDGFDGCDPDVLPHAETFAAWFSRDVSAVLACETPMVSELHRVGGTLDLAAVVSVPTICDLKTSKDTEHPHFSWRLQVAAYAALFYEATGHFCERRLIVHLPSNAPGTIRIHELPAADLAADWQAFLGLVRVYQRQRAHEYASRPMLLSKRRTP